MLPPAGPDRRKTPIRGRWGGPGVVLGQGWSGGGSGQGPRGSVGGRPLQLCDIFDCRSSLSAFLLIRLTFFSIFQIAGSFQLDQINANVLCGWSSFLLMKMRWMKESQIMRGKQLLCEHVKVLKLRKSSSVRMYEL